MGQAATFADALYAASIDHANEEAVRIVLRGWKNQTDLTITFYLPPE